MRFAKTLLGFLACTLLLVGHAGAQNKTVIKAYDVVFSALFGMYTAAARAAIVIGKDGIVKYAEQTPTLKDLPNFAAVKAALAN